mmetsp:Transcript_29221/g.74971  ORF Transcript_29221/g.74971 Transcript_29221/m.74971 type:complete len:277 (-) Transcript_29221:852-1682(-)
MNAGSVSAIVALPTYLGFGAIILEGTTSSVNSSSVSNPRARADSLSVVPSLCAFLATFAALSYPILLLRQVTSMRELCSRWSMRSLLATMPSTQLSVKEMHASPRMVTLCSSALIIMGLKTLSSKWPWQPPTVMAVWLPITWQQTMVSASHCVGLTLPGMMLLPGSFSGRLSSPRPQRGPLPRNRMSLAIFMSDTATVLIWPLASTSESWAASASNLLGAVTKGIPVALATSAATASAKPGKVLRPVPTAVPPCARRSRLGSALSTRLTPYATCCA